jgi:DNA-binding MarR family transcriptional regulator
MRLERVDGDVTDSQLSVLFVLAKHGPQTLSSLSEHDRVSPPSMNRTVNRLVEDGLVTRDSSPDDGRKVLIDLTETGESIVTQTKARRVAWFARQLSGMSDEQLAVLDAAAPILIELADS